MSGIAAHITIGHLGAGQGKALLKNVSDGKGAAFGLSCGAVQPDM
jgi:hypothetical protein